MTKPILSKLFSDFVHSEKSGGFVLIGCTIISLLIANSVMSDDYLNFWHQSVGFENDRIHLRHSIEYWINDGLMTIFFVLVGLEIERELYIGELSSVKNAMLPLFAAIGGMLVPAVIHFIFNNGTATQAGFGIPMATDIAFALGILSLLGNRVPLTLKIFLTAFAIIDDLGAILIIAIFYTKTISFIYLGVALSLFVCLLIMNRLRIHHLSLYILPGIFMWYCMFQSGVHATISGILFAFALPFGKGDHSSCSYRLQHYLHKPVAFIILPLFALANTGIIFQSRWQDSLGSRNSLGIMIGLVIGKPVGVLLFTYLAVKTRISQFAEDINWNHITGAALLGGIGFTMSIFITLLAFNDADVVVHSKIAVLISSCLSGVLGYIFLRINSKSSR